MAVRQYAKLLLIIAIALLSTTELTHSQTLQFDSLFTFTFGPSQTTECWGYTAADSQEYAIVGIDAGIVFVNATTLEIVDTVIGSGCGWQDMKTMGDYCYAVSECGTGLRVIDMKFLPDSVHLVGIFPMANAGRMSSHNLAIDTAAGFLYTEGSGSQRVSYHDLSNPENPVYSGGFGNLSTGFHDLFVHGDTAYLAEAGTGAFSIWDISDKQSPQMMVRVTIPNGGYVHNIWPTDDRRYVITTEETAGKTVKIWNIEDLNNVTLVGEYLGPSGIAHNAHIDGDYLYLSHYESGVRLVDISDPAFPFEVAFFDTYPASDNASFNGNWGVFPHTASGLVYASDRSGKLFILRTPVNKIFPDVQRFNMGSELMSRVLNHTPTFYWTFKDTIGSQTKYELEIGTDLDWTVAENWATGQVSTSDTTIVYAGSALVDGALYHIRIRVHNGTKWGEWRRSSFRMNSIPSVPVPFSPVNSFEIVPINVLLFTNNSVDLENDSLSYDFELYSDAALQILVFSQSNVAEQLDSTSTSAINNLNVNSQYWWRCRVTDGYEISLWSSASVFLTRTSKSFAVPTVYATISLGIREAQFGDSLLISPGTYMDNIVMADKGLTIISTGGPELTLLRPLDVAKRLITINGSDNLAELSGFTIGYLNTQTAIAVNTGANVILRDNIFRDFNLFQFMITIGNSNVTIEDNLFVNNSSEYCILSSGLTGTVNVINNTFDNNVGAMASVNAVSVFMNNIVSNTSGIGVNSSFATLDYNDFWNNATDYIAVSAGANDISVDPLFVSPGVDYSLQLTSPCIDAGSPDSKYNDPDGSRSDIGARAPGIITGVDDEETPLPNEFALHQNYPNPFNPSTQISFSLPMAANVTIEVFNILGQKIDLLVDSYFSAGEHSVTWDGTSYSGHPVSSGIYFYRLTSGDFSSTRKMLMLK